jgi:hypothetical protein
MDARPTAVCIHPGLSLCSMCSCDIVSPQKRLVCDYSCSAPELSVKVPHNRYRASRGDGGGVVHELYVPQLTGSNKRGNVCRCQRLPSHIAASCRFSERSERCDELASNVLRRTCDETRHAARARGCCVRASSSPTSNPISAALSASLAIKPAKVAGPQSHLD